jgi:hypothetical protein
VRPGINAKNVTDAAGFTDGAETQKAGLLFGDVEVDVSTSGHTVTITARKVDGADVALPSTTWTVPPEFR